MDLRGVERCPLRRWDAQSCLACVLDNRHIFAAAPLCTTPPQVEALMSKVAACMGKEGDATPFAAVTVDNISALLHRCAVRCAVWRMCAWGCAADVVWGCAADVVCCGAVRCACGVAWREGRG